MKGSEENEWSLVWRSKGLNQNGSGSMPQYETGNFDYKIWHQAPPGSNPLIKFWEIWQETHTYVKGQLFSRF